jgi:hypothetical protein
MTMETQRVPDATFNRAEAIEQIREKLWSETRDNECACAATARLGVLCRGFHRLDDRQVRARYAWLGANRPRLSRPELEGLIVAHHASRQDLRQEAVCCDVETRERCGCEGWDMFDDESLRKELQTLSGTPVPIR